MEWNNQFVNPWSKDHIELLRKIYLDYGISIKQMEKIFGRSGGSIRWKANSLGLKRTTFIEDKRCFICNSITSYSNQWYRDDSDRLLCSICWKRDHYKKKTKIRNGLLSKTSSTGKGLISEQVVCRYLNTQNLNIENNKFASNPIDAYNVELGKINIKGRKLSHGIVDGIEYSWWKFRFGDKNIINTYFLLGFDTERKNIIKAWIINRDKIINNTLYISNSAKGLLKFAGYETDAEQLNNILHSIGKECEYLYDIH